MARHKMLKVHLVNSNARLTTIARKSLTFEKLFPPLHRCTKNFDWLMNMHESVFYLNFITSYMTITIADNNKL